MTKPSLIETASHLRDDHDLGPAHAGHLVMATVVGGCGAALAVILSDGSTLQVIAAYMLGGWCGVVLVVLAVLWHHARRA